MDIIFLIILCVLLEALIKCIGGLVLQFKDKQIEKLRLEKELEQLRNHINCL